MFFISANFGCLIIPIVWRHLKIFSNLYLVTLLPTLFLVILNLWTWTIFLHFLFMLLRSNDLIRIQYVCAIYITTYGSFHIFFYHDMSVWKNLIKWNLWNYLHFHLTRFFSKWGSLFQMMLKFVKTLFV